MQGYYERNKDNVDFWKFQETYSWTSLSGEMPEEIKERQKEFDTFRTNCIFLFLLAVFVEVCRYRENPDKWKDKLKNDKFINWLNNKFGDKLKKLSENVLVKPTSSLISLKERRILLSKSNKTPFDVHNTLDTPS